MFSYFLKLALRGLKKNPLYTFIAVAGLVIGVGACVILVNYSANEKSYDNFHIDKDNIYRVESYFERNKNVTDSWVSSSFGYAAAMKTEFPEVKEITRVNNYDCERIVKYKENIYREPRVVMADSNFFSFFSYPLLEGNSDQVLKEPNSIVISESAAKKYFQNENPIGKILSVSTLKTKYNCAVTGIFKDFPHNSNLQLDLMISYSSANDWEKTSWYMHEAYTYVKANNEKDVKAIEQKFPLLAEKFKIEPAFKEHLWGINLVPVTSIHLNAPKPYEIEEKGSRNTINMLLLIAFVVLLISWINYINLFISRAMERAGEIGIRKMAGATFPHIFRQFVAESMVINLIVLVAFLCLMLAVIPFIEMFSLQDIFYGFWQNGLTWKICVLVFLGGTFITGVIPTLVLKNVKAALVLKNKLSFRAGLGNGLRKGLIVFQYFAAVALIVSTLTIRKQIKFMQSQNLGIATTQTLVFQTPPKLDSLYDKKMETLIERLKQISGVKYVTQSSAIPGKMVGYVMANSRADDPGKVNKMFETFRVDYDFLPAYNLQLIAGRNFSKSHPTDQEDAVILTQNAMQLFGFKNAEEAMNGSIYLEGHKNKRFRINGVVKDYHQLSLKENYRPIVFMIYSPWNWINNHYVSVKLDGNQAASFVTVAKNELNNFFPESSFDHFFLDDYFNRQYQQDIRYEQLVMFFSWLASLIVVLGIISMSGFMLLKRKKEISIRKVNGANAFQILQLLNKHFLKLLVIAFVTGFPVAMLGMHYWLRNFAWRTTVDVWILITTASITLFVTILTVSILSYRTAAQNPVHSLRCE